MTCPDIGDPSNGNIDFIGDSVAPFSIGTSAIYTCDTGYVLVGESVRICEDGNWNGTASICTRELTYKIHCKNEVSRS